VGVESNPETVLPFLVTHAYRELSAPDFHITFAVFIGLYWAFLVTYNVFFFIGFYFFKFTLFFGESNYYILMNHWVFNDELTTQP